VHKYTYVLKKWITSSFGNSGTALRMFSPQRKLDGGEQMTDPKCVNCGKPCRPSKDYPTSRQISTIIGYFCSMGCIRTYAVKNNVNVMKIVYGEE